MSDWLKINQCALDVGKKNFHRVGTIPGTNGTALFLLGISTFVRF